jgi:hypothetical protein
MRPALPTYAKCLSKNSLCSTRLAAVAILGCLAPVATGSLIYEPFDYSTGALLGQTNPSTGANWLRAGVSTGPTGIQVVSGSLYDPIGTAVGNSLAVNGIGDNSGSAERLAIVPVGVTSGTVYYSMELRGDALTGSNNTIGGFFIGLNNTGNTSQATNPTTVGAKIQARIDPVDASKYDIGIFANLTATAGAASWAPALTVGDSHFIVVSYTFNTGTTSDDVATMWIDPDPLTFGAGSAPVTTIATSTGGTDLGSVSSIIVRQSPAPWMTLDGLRLGTSWADVTSVPEPASLSMLVLPALAMFARRSRAARA